MRFLWIFGLTAFLAAAAFADVTSETTSLDQSCESLPKAGDSTRALCGGVGQYRLIVESDPLRSTLAVESHDSIIELNLFRSVSPAPNQLLSTAEWRLLNGVPIAVIIGLKTDTNPSDDLSSAEPTPSYNQQSWVIIKLDPTQSCVVNSIDAAAPNSLRDARKLADDAQNWGCV